MASDVLSISTKECGKDRRYMVLDGPVQTEQQEQKPFVQLLAKKKALEVPARILLSGAEHLRNLQNEVGGRDDAKAISSSRSDGFQGGGIDVLLISVSCSRGGSHICVGEGLPPLSQPGGLPHRAAQTAAELEAEEGGDDGNVELKEMWR